MLTAFLTLCETYLHHKSGRPKVRACKTWQNA